MSYSPPPPEHGRLFADDGTPTSLLVRVSDAAFDYILSNHEARDSGLSEITPAKLEWLYEELGHVKNTVPIPLERLAEFYRTFQIKFVMRQVENETGATVRVPTLQRHGWLQLLCTCFFKDPDSALNDLDQMIAQWDLADPLTAHSFQSLPRSSAPTFAVPVYAQRYSDLLSSFSSPSFSPSLIDLPKLSAPTVVATPPPESSATILERPSSPSIANPTTSLSTTVSPSPPPPPPPTSRAPPPLPPRLQVSPAPASPPPYSALEDLSLSPKSVEEDQAAPIPLAPPPALPPRRPLSNLPALPPRPTMASPPPGLPPRLPAISPPPEMPARLPSRGVNTFQSPILSSSSPLPPPARSTPLPALQKEKEREKFWGKLLVGDHKVSEAFVRLQIVLASCELMATEPTDEPEGLWTPWKEFLGGVSGGDELAEATRSALTDRAAYYDLFKTPYEMHICTVSDATKAQFPELAQIIQCCEGLQACLRYETWTHADWIQRARTMASFGVGVCTLLNDAIGRYNPIDPLHNRYFPEIPISCFPAKPTAGCKTKIAAWISATERKLWGEDLLVKEVGGRFEPSEPFMRFLKVSFNYVLMNAPATEPVDYVTLLDYNWWCSKVDDDRSAEISSNIETLDFVMRLWAKWGIPLSNHEVIKAGKSYGVLPCLDLDTWCQSLTYDAAYSPTAMEKVVTAAVDRWPLFEPENRLRYRPPTSAWPKKATTNPRILLAVELAKKDWKAAPPIYGALLGQTSLESGSKGGDKSKSHDSEAGERLRQLKEEEIIARKRNNNLLTAVKIITAVAGMH